jgi:uncharacterized protein YjfI (DUF2170 family)
MTAAAIILSLASLNPMHINGWQWDLLDEGQKTALVSGIIIGSVWQSAYYIHSGQVSVKSAIPDTLVNVGVERIIEELDLFYLREGNRQVPVGKAIFVAAHKW